MLHGGESTSFLLIHFFPLNARSPNCCTSSCLFCKCSSPLQHCRSATHLSPCYGWIGLVVWTASIPWPPSAPGVVTFGVLLSLLSPCTAGFPGCPHHSPPHLALPPALEVHILSSVLRLHKFPVRSQWSSVSCNEPPRLTALLLPGKCKAGAGLSN